MRESPRADIEVFLNRGFGPDIDALLRDIDDRISAADRPGLVAFLAAWPDGDDGGPQDLDGLHDRLLALRAGLPARRRAPQPGAAFWGFVTGGLLALPLGGLVFLFLSDFLLLPRALREYLAAPGFVIGGVTLVGAMLGARQGARPTRLGHAAMRGIAGLLVGGVAGALLGYAAFDLIGWLRNVSDIDGSYAMGIMFVGVPMAGLAGAVLLGGWMALRAWRGWA